MLIVSACLIGVNCKYDGGNNCHTEILELYKKGGVIPICPEQLGGLSTPRSPAEIRGGSGGDVLDGKARIITPHGDDVAEAFKRGAQESLKLAKHAGAKKAILKEKSPSCGPYFIYDGTFSGRIVAGKGVTAELFQREGIKVNSENDFKRKG